MSRSLAIGWLTRRRYQRQTSRMVRGICSIARESCRGCQRHGGIYVHCMDDIYLPIQHSASPLSSPFGPYRAFHSPSLPSVTFSNHTFHPSTTIIHSHPTRAGARLKRRASKEPLPPAKPIRVYSVPYRRASTDCVHTSPLSVPQAPCDNVTSRGRKQRKG